MEEIAIGFVKVPVSDLAQARTFYRDALGLTEDFAVEEYGWAQYATASVPLCLYVEGRGGGSGSPGGETGIQLRASDARRLHARLAAAGADVGPIATGDDGTVAFTVRDPDRNAFQIAEVA